MFRKGLIINLCRYIIMKFKYKFKDFRDEVVRVLKESHETISLILGLNCLFAWYLSGDGFILFTGAVLTIVSLVDLLLVVKPEEADEK